MIDDIDNNMWVKCLIRQSHAWSKFFKDTNTCKPINILRHTRQNFLDGPWEADSRKYTVPGSKNKKHQTMSDHIKMRESN